MVLYTTRALISKVSHHQDLVFARLEDEGCTGLRELTHASRAIHKTEYYPLVVNRLEPFQEALSPAHIYNL